MAMPAIRSHDGYRDTVGAQGGAEARRLVWSGAKSRRVGEPAHVVCDVSQVRSVVWLGYGHVSTAPGGSRAPATGHRTIRIHGLALCASSGNATGVRPAKPWHTWTRRVPTGSACTRTSTLPGRQRQPVPTAASVGARRRHRQHGRTKAAPIGAVRSRCSRDCTTNRIPVDCMPRACHHGEFPGSVSLDSPREHDRSRQQVSRATTVRCVTRRSHSKAPKREAQMSTHSSVAGLQPDLGRRGRTPSSIGPVRQGLHHSGHRR
jgi:hypothetical protein